MGSKNTRPKVFTHATFNVLAVLDLGKRVRQKTCNCDVWQTPATGSLNWAITICFEDGVEWIFRSPRTYWGVGIEMAGSLIASEVATLNCTKDNEIGVPFILMSKAQGVALSAWSWDTHRCSKVLAPHEKSRPCLSLTQKEKIMKQLGEITSQLSRLRFDYIGSVFEEEGTYQIKSCLSPSFCLYGRDEFKEEINRGPFLREREYYESLISAFLLHVECLPLEHHILLAPVPIPDEYNSYDEYLAATDRWNDFVTVGAKIDSSKNRLDYIALGRLLQDMIPSLVEDSYLSSNHAGAKYPLYHPDLSVNNIFVDDNNCNITCIIDWAFSTTVPLSALLATPSLPHPRDKMGPSLIRAFQNGYEAHQLSFAGVPEIMMVAHRRAGWDKCRNIWLFTRLVNLDSLQDVYHFTELYTLLLAEGEVNIPILLKTVKAAEDFSRKAGSLVVHDPSSCDIEREEREYFSQVGPKRLALSRKLTLISYMNVGFIADQRLWRWLAEAGFLQNICSVILNSSVKIYKLLGGLMLLASGGDFDHHAATAIEYPKKAKLQHARLWQRINAGAQGYSLLRHVLLLCPPHILFFLPLIRPWSPQYAAIASPRAGGSSSASHASARALRDRPSPDCFISSNLNDLPNGVFHGNRSSAVARPTTTSAGAMLGEEEGYTEA
ncbi:MAG: hypothetical protein Q9163_000667 [Psora crenata]